MDRKERLSESSRIKNLKDKPRIFAVKIFLSERKKSVAYQFRIALLDTNSNKVGSALQFIEVPNIRKRMALSNIILDNFTTEEWCKIKLGGSGDSKKKRFVRYDIAPL